MAAGIPKYVAGRGKLRVVPPLLRLREAEGILNLQPNTLCPSTITHPARKLDRLRDITYVEHHKRLHVSTGWVEQKLGRTVTLEDFLDAVAAAKDVRKAVRRSYTPRAQRASAVRRGHPAYLCCVSLLGGRRRP